MIRSFFTRAVLVIASLGFVSAATASTVTIKDGTGTSQTFGTTTRTSDSALIYNMDTVVQGSMTDIGASVTANTATTLVAATTTRRGFAIQNQTTGACYMSGVTTATADYHSLMIAAGSYYESKDSHVGTGAISIICVNAGGVYARQW